MSDPWTSIVTLVGGGGTLAAIAAIIVYVTRGAIATAVTQAGAREIVRLKDELERALAKDKQAFDRELARERDNADRLLEQFKSQLTLEAEVRRQVAAKKVDVVVRFIDLGNRLPGRVVEPVLWKNGVAPNTYQEIHKAMVEYRSAFREGEAFLGAEARQAIEGYRTELEDIQLAHVKGGSEGPTSMVAVERVDAARVRFFQALRRELQIETGENVEKKP
jgi:hypothetical protein